MSDTEQRLLLPGITWFNKPKQEDFEYWDLALVRQILGASRLLGGDLDNPTTGIVAQTDPISNTILLPVQDSADQFLVRVQPGFATTSNGQIIEIDEIHELEVPDTPSTYVLVANYEPIDSPNERTDPQLQTRRAPTRVLPEDLPLGQQAEFRNHLLLVLLSVYQDTATAGELLRKRTVPLGVIEVVEADDGTVSVTVDTSRAKYPFNRPWHSSVDIVHRSDKNNPHNTAFDNLDSGALPFFVTLAKGYALVGAPFQVPGVPGRLCTDVIDRARIEGNFLVRLQTQPAVLGKLYAQDTENFDYEHPYTYDPDSNSITLLGPIPPELDKLVLDYTKLVTYEPTLIGTSVRAEGGDGAWEVAISGGTILRTPTTQTVEVTRVGLGSHFVEVFVDADNQLIQVPFPVVCQSRLSADFPEGEEVEIGIGLPAPAALRFTLSDTDDVSVTLEVFGVNESGTEIVETIQMDVGPSLGTGGPALLGQEPDQLRQISDLLPPNADVLPVEWTHLRRLVSLSDAPTGGAFFFSTKLYTEVTKLRVTGFSGTVNSILTVVGLPDMRTNLPVARCFVVNGQVQTFDDIRPISPSLIHQPSPEVLALDPWQSGVPAPLVVEDVRSPRYADIRRSYLDPRPGERLYYLSRRIPASGDIDIRVAASADAQVTVRYKVAGSSDEVISVLAYQGGIVLEVQDYIVVEVLGLRVYGLVIREPVAAPECSPIASLGQALSHTHTLTIPPQDVAIGATKTYTTSSTSVLPFVPLHSHQVTLTNVHFASLQNGGTVQVQTTTSENHSHIVTVTCATV